MRSNEMLSLPLCITSYQSKLSYIPMMKMVTVFYVSLFSLIVSGSSSPSICGPEACGLTCAEEESCVQDLEVGRDITGQCIVFRPTCPDILLLRALLSPVVLWPTHNLSPRQTSPGVALYFWGSTLRLWHTGVLWSDLPGDQYGVQWRSLAGILCWHALCFR